MAYLATLIPGPRLYHRHHEAGRVPYRHRKRVDALLDRLHRLGQLEDAAWARAKKARLRFAPEPAP
jgi:membrane peptidoglycan carboxypeptidase